MYDEINSRLYHEKLYKQLAMRFSLKDLTEDQKALLRLNIVDERGAEEIAQILNRDVKEVRWELNKLKTDLRKLARTGVDEPSELI